MDNEITPPVRGGFQPGHARVGGRKRTVSKARELAEKYGDPLVYMLKILQSGVYEKVTIDANGKTKKTKVAAPLSDLIDLAKACTFYIHPKLSATQLTGANEGPIQNESVSLNLSAILSDPELCAAAQKLAIAMVADEQAQGQQTTPVYGLLESGDSKQ
jgi:hypothetical protein